MGYELWLLTLSLIFCASLLTAVFLFLRMMSQQLQASRELNLQLSQLLASKDVVAYDALRRTTLSETPDQAAAPYYYTGDAVQYENEKLDGRVSDDELTGISSFGV